LTLYETGMYWVGFGLGIGNELGEGAGDYYRYCIGNYYRDGVGDYDGDGLEIDGVDWFHSK